MSLLVFDIRYFHSINSVPTELRKWFNTIIIGYLTHRYLWDFLHHIHSGDNWCGVWQLIWPFRFVTVSVLWPFRFVAVPVCGRSGLRPFRFVAVPVCGRFGLWPFRFVAIPVCGRFGLWPFRIVIVSVCGLSVCGRFGCGLFGLWPFRFVAVMTCYRIGMHTIINLKHTINLFPHCRINHNPCISHLSAIFVTIKMLHGLQKSTSTACITQWYTALVWLILIYVSSKSPRNIFARSNRFSGQWL